MLLPDKAIIFSHDMDGTTSACSGVANYLLERKIKHLLICHFPFLRSQDGSVKIELYQKGRKRSAYKSWIRFFRPQPISYFKDFILAIFYGIRHGKNTDLLIGTPNILVVAGIFLRWLGLVKKVVYYQIDYTPQRYQNKFLNNLYYAVDKYASYACDEVWALTEEMIRQKALDQNWDLKKITYRLVPTGNDSDKLKKTNWGKYHQNRIVYFGGIFKNKGAELFVPIANSLLQSGFSDFTIECVGGGEVASLKKEIKKNRLTKHFVVHGEIEDLKKVEKILLQGAIALAPYFPGDKNNFSFYSDPGKIKHYLACGLPMVITAVPPIAVKLQQEGVGLVSDYNSAMFAQSIIKLLSDKQKLQKMKKKARDLGLSYSWKNIFDSVFNN